MARRTLTLLVLAVLGACGGETEADSGEPNTAVAPCVAPNRLAGGACREPGVQDNGCPAGTWRREDGSCQPGGIPPERCAPGFAPTAALGCEPILPATRCPAGLMALPGETECRPVMTCGEGRWGDIPVDATTLYVDQSYTQGGGPSDGSAERPFTTIGAAVAAAASGALVAVAAGSYVEDVSILGKAVRLWGTCPAEVEIVGAASALAAVFVRGSAADGSELVGLAVRGQSTGVVASGVEAVHMHGLWIHDNAERGVELDDALGPTSALVSSSLVESNVELGISVLGADVGLDAVVVRGTLPRVADQALGRGIDIHTPTGGFRRARAFVRNAVVEDNHDVGVLLGDADAELEALVVRGTLPDLSDQTGGRGISLVDYPGQLTRARTLVRATLVEQSHEVGIFVEGVDAQLEAVQVRGTRPRASDQMFGRGIQIQDHAVTGYRSNAVVRTSLIEHNHEVGVSVAGSDAELEAVAVRETAPDVADQLSGRGINIQINPRTAARANVVVRSSVIEQSHELGLFVAGSNAELDGVAIRDTLPEAATQTRGRGLGIQYDAETGERASALVQASLVERSLEYGVIIGASDAQLSSVAVLDTSPRLLDGLAGDGINAINYESTASLELSSCFIARSARAGLSVFGAAAVMRGSSVTCSALPLCCEPFQGSEGSLVDLGENRCYCDDEPQVCVAIAAGLEPPEPVGVVQ